MTMLFIGDIKDWCHGKNWTWRIGLLLFFIYLGVRYLVDPAYYSFFGGANLGVHELGHILFGFLGQFMAVAGGTITQLAAPIICAVMFWRQPDYFAISLAGVWLATNLYGVAVYVADAQNMELPLVSVGGGEVYHDWEYMLSTLNILYLNGQIAQAFRITALLLMWLSIAYGCWIVWLMIRSLKPADKS